MLATTAPQTVQLPTGALSPLQQDCAFLWLYCLDGVPYKKYLEDGAPPTMPMVMATLRWDGTFGTLGGKVDPGESLKQALAREVFEESSYRIPEGASIEALGTFTQGEWHVHSFALELTADELFAVRANAYAGAEVAGYCIVPTFDYRPGYTGPRGVSAFRMNQFCGTAKVEFELLVETIKSRVAQRTA